RCYSESLYIGKNSNPSSNATATLNMVSGLMDEIKIYKKALGEAEIVNYYNFYEVPEIEFDDIWLQNILTDDIYKTQYHGGPYQHWMNEPHAPGYYNGYYHLFFQFNPFGPYFRNICWGHLVSTDMVNWKPLKEVITPTNGSVCPDGVWSGGISYDSNGVPVLFFTAGDDSFREHGLISNQNIGIARPKDISDPYLTEWEVDSEYAIKQVSGQGRPGQFRDAHVFKEGDTWCMLVGSASTKTNGGCALLYTTKDDSFHNWDYRGQLYEMVNQPGDLGQVWELPVLLPIYNKDKTIKKYLFIISPAPADTADNDIYYWIGDFDLTSGRFTPDESFGKNPRLFDYGNNVFTGPSGFVDPVSGNTYIMSIMQDQRKPSDVYKSGWANCVGLTRQVYLNDNGTDCYIKPVEALKDYQEEVLLDVKNKSVEECNNLLKDIKGDMLYIKLTIDNESAANFGIKVRYNESLNQETTLYYQNTSKLMGIKTGLSGKQNISGNFYGDLELTDNHLTIEIYLDRSMVEAFYNDQKAISSRIYPDKDSLGLLLFESGGVINVESLYITTMGSIYE
ncbi:MAG: glycoside hydrolase family 32 protein, partial [Acholeplasmatales bacterium]|nr:glycoside hydrolase family 32 protein [Acholeplasmatales bacterium]